MAIQMYAPFHFISTPAAVAAFRDELPALAREAFLEIGRVARGYEIHNHQFRASCGAVVAVASRVKKSGIIEIELDLGDARLVGRTFTAAEAARAPRRYR